MHFEQLTLTRPSKSFSFMQNREKKDAITVPNVFFFKWMKRMNNVSRLLRWCYFCLLSISRFSIFLFSRSYMSLFIYFFKISILVCTVVVHISLESLICPSVSLSYGYFYFLYVSVSLLSRIPSSFSPKSCL